MSAILPAVFCISFAGIAWQLALMRCLTISKYHHFTFLIISCALLGFGAGGTLLSLRGAWLKQRHLAVLRWGTLCFGLSVPVCFRIGEALPVDVYFPPGALFAGMGWWFAFWLVHLVPFLLAGILIGLALMTASRKAHIVYATSLAGSAAGALGGILMLDLSSANVMVIPIALLVMFSALPLGLTGDRHQRLRFGAALAAGIISLGSAYLVAPERLFPLRVDQYKTLAYLRNLVRQGSAELLLTLHGARGRIELFRSPHLHTLMSLGTGGEPSAMDVLVRDGFQIGSVLDIKKADEARFLESSLLSLPYRIGKPKRVLILGDTGGIHVWLARLSPAESIVVVQPDKNVLNILESHPSRVLDDPRIRVVRAEPRAFLDVNRTAYDIIHLAALEGFSAGSSGIGGLREDYLATVEGFGKCLDSLSEDGTVCVVRGIQDPARDNLKIAATWIEALEGSKIANPGDRILVARDELSVATLASLSDFGSDRVELFREACKKLSWDPEWFPNVKEGDTNSIHVLPGPDGTRISWYHHSIKKMLSPDREDFYRQWICQISPATDDRPFFHDFFRWGSVLRLREVFGPIWPARSEMGFLLLLISGAWSVVIAALLIPVPVVIFGLRRASGSRPTTTSVVIYFASLGAAFMFVEMSLIQICTRFLGDSVLSAALVLGGLLFFAGAGSLSQPAVAARFRGGIVLPLISLAGLVVVYSAILPFVLEAAAGLSAAQKVIAGLLFIAPPGFLMGLPFPWGISALESSAPDAIPIAWAVNGFASVISTAGAVLIAMTYGFTAVSWLAALLYVVPAVLLVKRRL